MQAIQTKYLSPTDTKGARIKAFAQRGSIFISYPYELNQDDAHKLACSMLKEKFAQEDHQQYRQPIETNPWMKPTVCGWLPNGNCAHVFL